MAVVSLSASGIYCIRNAISGRRYVGSSVNMPKRWREHVRTLRLGRHHAPALQRSWIKHGQAAFEFQVLELVDARDALLQREQAWIDRLHASCPTRGFNTVPVAGSRLGSNQREEVRKHLSDVRRSDPALMASSKTNLLKVTPEARAIAARKTGDALRGKSRLMFRKFTYADAEAMRSLRIGGETYRAIGTRYGIDGAHAYNIIVGKTHQNS